MLTTLDRLKSMPGFTLYDDTHLSFLISAVSVEIETYLNRQLSLKQIVERRDGQRAGIFLHLSRYPVTELVSIEADGEEISDADLVIPELGRLYRKAGWPSGVANISVTYSGGYILPGNEGANLPENIELACILEVQQALRTPGVTSERVGEISVSYANEKLSSASRSLLDGFRRFA